MSVYLAGSVAAAYATGVITVHRVAVARRRSRANGWPTLKWLDWDALLRGVLPLAPLELIDASTPVEGGPAPLILQRSESKERSLLDALVSGAPVQGDAFSEAKFSGGEARWLSLLSNVRDEPLRVLEQLEETPHGTIAEAYLREWLALEHTVNPLNLEWLSFGSKLRINRAMRRFGDHPELFFIRARASALLGFTQGVLDDLARAVYFSRQSRFYLEAVTALPFVNEARPALFRACREAMTTIPDIDG